MRSRVERLRLPAERLLRAVSIALLAWLLWSSVRPIRSSESRLRVASSRTIGDSLSRWSVTALDGDSLHMEIDTVPDRASRDWLTALRRNGASISWSGPPIPAIAVALTPVGYPGGGVRVAVAAPTGARISVADALGRIDTLTAASGGASLRTRAVAMPLVAMVDGQTARTAEMDSLLPRRVAVVGRADWESKFLIAALEENGWGVDALLSVAPGVDVVQGSAIPLDTARHAAVIVLDSSGARMGARARKFLRDGGGVVLAGSGARVEALASVAPGKSETRRRAATMSFTSRAPRRALAYHPVADLRDDAVSLEALDGGITVAARREGNGRVVQVGYDETWRWRMMGGEGATVAHREWWSNVVAGAAYRAVRGVERNFERGGPPPMKQSNAAFPRAGNPIIASSIQSAQTATAALDATPLASLIDALGVAQPRPAIAPSSASTNSLSAWMLVTLFITLLAEWASRRLRGAS